MTRQEYNLLTADLFERLPIKTIGSPEGQAVIRYFCDKLTRPAKTKHKETKKK
jgi:hypothetical protein